MAQVSEIAIKGWQEQWAAPSYRLVRRDGLVQAMIEQLPHASNWRFHVFVYEWSETGRTNIGGRPAGCVNGDWGSADTAREAMDMIDTFLRENGVDDGDGR